MPNEKTEPAARRLEREAFAMRVLWMLLFAVIWRLAEWALGGVVLLQLGYRTLYGAPSATFLRWGDSLSQYLAQVARYATFNTEIKPWPVAEWPQPQVDVQAHTITQAAHPVRDEEPRL